VLAAERRNKIKELILQKGYLKISELSRRFGVSEMTIHRDLKPLIEEGMIVKTFGGVALRDNGQSAGASGNECAYCSRRINERLSFRLILTDNRIEVFCCAHCGLIRWHQCEDEVIQAICYDFLRQTTISAFLAAYVMDTPVHIGCCQPQLLPFEWREHAENFVKGFGGKVYSFKEAAEELMRRMGGEARHCRHG